MVIWQKVHITIHLSESARRKAKSLEDYNTIIDAPSANGTSGTPCAKHCQKKVN